MSQPMPRNTRDLVAELVPEPITIRKSARAPQNLGQAHDQVGQLPTPVPRSAAVTASPSSSSGAQPLPGHDFHAWTSRRPNVSPLEDNNSPPPANCILTDQKSSYFLIAADAIRSAELVGGTSYQPVDSGKSRAPKPPPCPASHYYRPLRVGSIIFCLL